MHLKLNELKQHLAPSYTDEAQLSEIKQLCTTHISRDISYTGTPENQYQQYYKLINSFIEQYDSLSLHAAAQLGYDQFLLSQNITKDVVNQPDSNGMSTLHIAAIYGHVFTIAALLSIGAEPEQLNDQQQLPIHCTLYKTAKCPKEMIHKKEVIFTTLLTQAPKTWLQKDNKGNTVFHYMIKYGFIELFKTCMSENNKGAFLSNNLNHYPIHTAMLKNCIESVHLLLEIDGVSALKDTNEHTPIHFAALYVKSPEIIEACCKKTVNLNKPDSMGKTALILAVENNNLDALQILVGYGADVTIPDKKGLTILHYAVLSKNAIIIDWVLKHTSIDINKTDEHRKTARKYCTDTALDELFVQYEQDHTNKL
jgi:uncharacterized protein